MVIMSDEKIIKGILKIEAKRGQIEVYGREGTFANFRLYVIYLNTERHSRLSNSYGYWTGKKCVVQGEEYPICDNAITENTKVYKNRSIAEKSAEKAYMRFSYVKNYEVEEVN